MKQVKFIKYGSSTFCGNFGPGDTLRCPEDVAAHLVNDAGVAEFVTPPPQPEPAVAAPEPPKARKGKKP